MKLSIKSNRVSGHQRGKKIGVPTINILVPAKLNISHGIYAGYLIEENIKYKAAIHYGPRPVYKETDPSFEIHIIDTNFPKLKSKEVNIEIVEYIREVRNFETEMQMVEQIKIDVQKIKQILELG